jgi:hypothetical protein
MVSMEDLLKRLKKAREAMDGSNYGIAYSEIKGLEQEIARGGVTFGVFLSMEAYAEFDRLREREELAKGR